MHPTRQLGALSKREVRYISTKLFSPFRGAFSYIPARLIAELRTINPMSSSSNQLHMQFFHNIRFLQHLCDTCHSGLTRGLKKQIFCDPFFLYCDPFFGYTFRPYINQNQMSFNSTIYTIWYMLYKHSKHRVYNTKYKYIYMWEKICYYKVENVRVYNFMLFYCITIYLLDLHYYTLTLLL